MSLIRTATASNVRAFQNLANALVTSEGDWADSIDLEGLEDEIGRFRVWSGNLGALQKGHSSLDYRLRDSPLLSTNALKFLKELEDNLNEAVAVVSGVRLPYELQPKPEQTSEEEDDNDGFFDDDEDEDDDEDGSTGTELSMRFTEIVDIIDNLYKLSVRIRTPTIRSRSLKAATYKPKDPDTGIDILSIYAGYDLQHIKELLSHLRQPHQEGIGGNEYDYLTDRLSAAVTLRRRQFKYWKRHRDKLGMSTVLEELPSQPILERPNPPQRNDTLEAHPDTPVIVTTKEALSQKTGRTLLSGTEATQHHQSLDEILDTKSVTSYAVTVKDLHGKGVELPPPPRAADGDKDFECPYCYIICPARYGRGRAWRTHLLQDLQPYVCTYPNCESSEQLFRSRREWAEHEASHRKAWRCPEHPTAIYKTSNGLAEHLRREHSDSFPDSQLPAIVKVGETTTVDIRLNCPICYAPTATEGLGDFHNHIANHLERIATFALPNGMEDESDGASSAASRGRSDSGSSRNINDLSLPSEVTVESDEVRFQPRARNDRSSDSLDEVLERIPQSEQTQGRAMLSAESLHQLPDSSNNRLDTLLSSGDQYENPKISREDDTSSASSASIDYPAPDVDGPNKEAVLNLYDIPTLRSLYRSRRLLQRDQSVAPSDSHNQIVSFCHHDLTKLKVDAIVNSANKRIKLTNGTTLNNTILRAAGPGLTEEARAKGRPSPDQAILTRGYELPSKHVIHVSRPGYTIHKSYKSYEGTKQFNQLIDCYRSAFKVAIEYGVKTIAFPCIGTGGVGFPPRVAARIALQEIREYLDARPEHQFERIIFCVNSAVDEQAYLDFFPVYFPPTHGDLDAARSSIWTEDRAALALQVLDTRGVVQKVFADLNTGLSLSISDFPKSILDDLSGIDSSLSSIRRYLVWKKELKTSLRDLKLACSVMQLFGGSITELIELAKDHASLGQRSDKSIWDDFVSDMIDRHGTDPSSLLKVCRSFFVWLDQIITVEYIELDDIPDMRRKLERYKFWVRDARDGAGTQPHLDEVLYTREFQREATAHTRDTVKLHQIQSIQQLYKLGELEEKPTLAHPSAIFNNAVCLAREDITKLEVDVLVSSTDMTFAGMGTLDRIVFLKGGSELRQAVTAFGTCKEGDVKVTKGYLLPAKHVLHVIPPEQLRKDTKNVLRNIYREVLHTAVAMRATSIAIPSIGTGMLNYPRRDVTSLAMEEVKRFLETADPNSLIEKIIFVVYSSNDEFIYKSLLPVYFPPIDLNANRALPASTPAKASSSASDSKETPKRTLFGSIGEAVRSVRFGKTPEPSRPISPNEEYALIKFESHAKDCETCKDVQKLYAEGRDLCEQGYSLAQVVLWHMNMHMDHSVYRKPDANGISFRLEVPAEMFPISMSLLEIVEKSYRDGNRSQPFVTPNRPYGTVVEDQTQEDVIPPGVTIHSAEVEVPLHWEPGQFRARVLEWSDQEMEWKLLSPGEISVSVLPDTLKLNDTKTSGGHVTLLETFHFGTQTIVKRRKTTPEVILAKIDRRSAGLHESVSILIQCKSDADCKSLRSRLQEAIGRLGHRPAEEASEKSSPAQSQADQYPTDEALTATERWNYIREELASVKRASGGLSDLQTKMERLSAATSTLNPNRRQREVASELYDASRSPLATRILLCLMADLKSRPGSYIGLKTDSIVSAVRATSAEVHLALKELEDEGQIHKTVDDYTWVISHPPKDLPVLSTNELEQDSEKNTSSDPQNNERRHVQLTDAEDSDFDVPERGAIEQDIIFMESDQQKASEDTDTLIRKSLAKHIARKVHGYLVEKGGTTLDGALHVEDIAKGVHETPSEVRKALATLEKQGRAHVPAISLDNWWIATPGNAEQPRGYRGTEASQASSLAELQDFSPLTDLASPNVIIRDPPTFADAPRAPSPTSGPPTDFSSLDLSTMNIDEFFSYPSPFGARWTRIDKRLVDPQVLTQAEEEFDDTGDSLVVHRVLRRGEIRRWAEQSLGMRDHLGATREAREKRGHVTDRTEDEGKGKERDQQTKPSVAVLRNWLEANLDSPYPDKEQLEILAQQTGRSARQTRTALSNMRARMTPGLRSATKHATTPISDSSTVQRSDQPAPTERSVEPHDQTNLAPVIAEDMQEQQQGLRHSPTTPDLHGTTHSYDDERATLHRRVEHLSRLIARFERGGDEDLAVVMQHESWAQEGETMQHPEMNMRVERDRLSERVAEIERLVGKREGKGKGKEREERDREQERLDRVLEGGMREGSLRHFGDEDDERFI